MRFIICEDGSRDNTQDVLQRLAEQIPMKLILSKARKGYSRAVRDGMEAMESPYLLCLDSDGQCDPQDFPKFWEAREDTDVVIGWRVERADSFFRRCFSRLFYLLYQCAFRVPIHDPSCPYILSHKDVVAELAGNLGAMQQGFWWEYVANAHRRGYRLKEAPIHHRLRAGGTTQVYKVRKMPGIFVRHLLAIFTILRTTRGYRAAEAASQRLPRPDVRAIRPAIASRESPRPSYSRKAS